MDGEIFLENQKEKSNKKLIKIKLKLKSIKLLADIKNKWKC